MRKSECLISLACPYLSPAEILCCCPCPGHSRRSRYICLHLSASHWESPGFRPPRWTPWEEARMNSSPSSNWELSGIKYSPRCEGRKYSVCFSLRAWMMKNDESALNVCQFLGKTMWSWNFSASGGIKLRYRQGGSVWFIFLCIFHIHAWEMLSFQLPHHHCTASLMQTATIESISKAYAA